MSTDDLVWYAAFGSNLSRERFQVYLSGGAPPRSTDPTPQSGARDQTPPRSTWAGTVSGELYFGATSDRWGGCGVAFFDPTSDRETLMRAYLVTVGQLEDVYRQENRSPDVIPIDLASLATTGHLDLLPSRYRRLAQVGTHDDGLPMVTITSATRQDPNSPHHSYLLTIADGLREAFDLPVEDLVDYLTECHGIVGTEAQARLTRQLRDN